MQESIEFWGIEVCTINRNFVYFVGQFKKALIFRENAQIAIRVLFDVSPINFRAYYPNFMPACFADAYRAGDNFS